MTENVNRIQALHINLVAQSLNQMAYCKSLTSQEEFDSCFAQVGLTYHPEQDNILQQVSDQKQELENMKVELSDKLATLMEDIQDVLDANNDYARLDLVTCIANAGNATQAQS